MPLPLVSPLSTIIITTLFFLSLLFPKYAASDAARSPAPTLTLIPFFPQYYVKLSPPDSPHAPSMFSSFSSFH